jgi:hypothetical protein
MSALSSANRIIALTAQPTPQPPASYACFATVAEAAAGQVDPKVGWLQVLGYYAPGDGGGAFYAAIKKEPRHAGKLLTADGRWWTLIGTSFNVRQFGARGDGETDDTQSIQNALSCRLVLALHFPAGSYKAVGLSLSRTCQISGDGGAELFWDGEFTELDLLKISGTNASVTKMRFRGSLYEDFETQVTPYTLLRFYASSKEPFVENVRVLDCDFIGGQIGCTVGEATDVLIERVRFIHCRRFALTFQRGQKNILIRGLVAREIGTYGGIKTTWVGSRGPTERMVITDFDIADCGKLDPKSPQEGIDLVCGFARNWVVTNGVISDCGGGGIELKVPDVVTSDDEVYEDIVISNVVIHVNSERGGIKLDWHGEDSTESGKQGRRVLISNNIVRHTGATMRSAAGVVVMGWADVSIVDNRFEGAFSGVNLRATGGPNNAASRIYIANNVFHDVTDGIDAWVGGLDKVRITGNDIRARARGVQVEGARAIDLEIDNNTIVQTEAASDRLTHAGVFILQAESEDAAPEAITLRGNWIRAKGGHAIDAAGPGTEGRIFDNVLEGSTAPVSLKSGTWEVVSNHVFKRAEYPAILTGDAAKVSEAYTFDASSAARESKPGERLPKALRRKPAPV